MISRTALIAALVGQSLAFPQFGTPTTTQSAQSLSTAGLVPFVGLPHGPYNGTTILSNGTAVLSNGTTVLSNGTTVLSNGTTVLSNGTSIVLSNGTTVTTGAIGSNNGTFVFNNGTAVGTTQLSNGTFVLQNGTTFANGTTVLTNGTVVTILGALTGSIILGSSITSSPPPPGAFSYPSNGQLVSPQPAPFLPAGGVGTNGTEPVYRPMSDYDYQSLALTLYHTWLSYDLLIYGINNYNESDFETYGLTVSDRDLLQVMVEQELARATVITNLLGPQAPKPCSYNYPVTNLEEYIDLNQKLATAVESTMLGYVDHLDSGAAGQLISQSAAIKGRQQLIFRQFEGLSPLPVSFAAAIPQAWGWSYSLPLISYCPSNQTRLVWQDFPLLTISDQPNPALINGSSAVNQTLGAGLNVVNTTGIAADQFCFNATTPQNCSAAISPQNRTTPLSYPGRQVFLQWDGPGQSLGPNNTYVSTTTASTPRYALWVNQINATYTPLTAVGNGMAYTFQPNATVFDSQSLLNGTTFLAVTDNNLPVTPYNLTQINPSVYAVGVYQAS